jgi:hypothetical protein
MKLFSLEIQNFLQLKKGSFTFETSSNFTLIEAKADQGKTSWCDAVSFVFFGQTESCPPSEILRCIHWDAEFCSVICSFYFREKLYRLERHLTCKNQQSLNLFHSSPPCEFFSPSASLAEKQKELDTLLRWDFSSFLQGFFISSSKLRSLFQNPQVILEHLAQVDELKKHWKALSASLEDEKQQLNVLSAQHHLAQSLLQSFLAPSQPPQTPLSLEKPYARLQNLKAKQEALQKLPDLFFHYTLHLYHCLETQKIEEIKERKNQILDYLDHAQSKGKESLRSKEARYAQAQLLSKIHQKRRTRLIELRYGIQIQLQNLELQLADNLLRNPQTSKEELCLSPSRLAQLTYILNEIEDVRRDNRIRNFMSSSILFIFCLMIPVFFYVRSKRTLFAYEEVQIQVIGGFLLFMIFLLLWYLSQRIKNQRILLNLRVFETRLQQEITRLEHDKNTLSSYLQGPPSFIDLEQLQPPLRHLFKQLLWEEEHQKEYNDETLSIETQKLTKRHLSKNWDTLHLCEEEKELQQLQWELQELRQELHFFRETESFLNTLVFPEDSYQPHTSRTYTSKELQEELILLREELTLQKNLRDLPNPSPLKVKEYEKTLDFLNLDLSRPSASLRDIKNWIHEKKIILETLSPQEIGEEIQALYREFPSLIEEKSIAPPLLFLQEHLQKEQTHWEDLEKACASRIPHLQHQIQVKTLLKKLWEESLEVTQSRLFPFVQGRASQYLPRWTKGALGTIHLSAIGEIRVFCSKKKDFVLLEQLGETRKRLVLLALYCSIAGVIAHLIPEDGAFLLLDSPGACLDLEEQEVLLEGLREASSTFHQFIVTTSCTPPAFLENSLKLL